MMKSLLMAALLTVSAHATQPRTSQVNINIGSVTFTATLHDTPTAKAFKARLPLTIRMSSTLR